MSNKAGINWSADGHTAVPVPVYAIGEGQDHFLGYYDNTDIARKMAEIMEISLEANGIH
jgi:alkaline phosphatase